MAEMHGTGTKQEKSACFCSLFGIASSDNIQAKGIATSYWGPITAESNYVNMIKPEVMRNAEAEMSEVGRLLDFRQHHETLQNFYNSLKVLKSRHKRLKFMNRFSAMCLSEW